MTRLPSISVALEKGPEGLVPLCGARGPGSPEQMLWGSYWRLAAPGRFDLRLVFLCGLKVHLQR